VHIRIDSSNIDYDEVLTALTLSKQDKVSFLVLIIEDIGGTTLHERSNSRQCLICQTAIRCV
jgi:hypothetical protein